MPSKRRKRSSGKRAARSSSPAITLPAVTFADHASTSSDDAIAALDDVERATRDQDDTDTPDTSSDAGAGVLSSPAPGRADATAQPPDRTRELAPSPALEQPKTPPAKKPVREVSITGAQFAKLDKRQLQTALAIETNKSAALEARVAELAPLAATKTVVALERATGVIISALFDIVALATDVEETRLDDDEEKELGELGAPALAPYLGEYAKHLPLVAFGAKLTDVIVTKVLVVKAAKAEQRAAKERDDK